MNLKKPAGWKPNPSAAILRYAAFQKQLWKATTSSRLQVADAAGSEDLDFEGLNQLLQEDLLAAALTSPSVASKFAGPSSYMAKLVAALSAGDAPAPVSILYE